MKKLVGIFCNVHSASKWNEGLTDTTELGWSSCDSSRCWLIVNVGFFSLGSDKEKVQVREVRNWGGDRKEFRLVELSRWIIASEWILWMCTGYLYPDDHLSLQFWGGSKLNHWVSGSRASKFSNCLRMFPLRWWGNSAKTRFEIVLEYSRWSDEEIWLIQVLKLS